MFKPRFTITNKLLRTINEIKVRQFALENLNLTEIVLVKFNKRARVLSAYSSTAIEGNNLGLTAVKQLLKTSASELKTTEQEVWNYNQVLEKLQKSKHFTLNTKSILEIHKQLMIKLLPRSKSGQLRKEPVFVNDPSCKRATIFWPPDHQDLDDLLTDLIRFINKNTAQIDPILLAGIFHKQFILIHPFIDGNGRSARILTKQILDKGGLDTFHLFSFENYYNDHLNDYFHHVGERGNYYDLVDEIDFTAWLEFFTDGILHEMKRVQEELKLELNTPLTHIATHHQKILNYIAKHGYITDSLYEGITKRAKATRVLDFNYLIKLGIIQRQGRGKSTYYIKSSD